jgi:ATP-dependent Clp protease ATP-binding subunit ClpC
MGWPGFSENARRVLDLTIQVAAEAKTGEVSTGHLLLGILRVEECGAFGVLRHLDVPLDELEHQTMALLPAPVAVSPEPSVSPAFKQVIDLAMALIRESKTFVRTEHLLIGLVTVETCTAARALRCLNVDAPQVNMALKARGWDFGIR